MSDQSAMLRDTLEEHYRTLLEVGEAIAAHRDIKALFKDLAKRLPALTPFDVIGLILHDPERKVMKAHVLESAQTEGYPEGLELPMEESASAWVLMNQRPLVMPDLEEETRFPKVVEILQSINVRSCCFLPLTTAVRPLGAMEFGSFSAHRFEESELAFLGQVAKQVAVAVDNVLHQQDLAHDRDRLRLLLQVTESIVSYRDLNLLLSDLAKRLPDIVPFDFIYVALHDSAREVMRLWLLFTVAPSTIQPGLETPMDEAPGGLVWRTQQPLVVDDVSQEHRFPKLMPLFRENGVQSFCVVPLTTAQRRLGAMGFGSVQKKVYQEAEIAFMQQVAKQVAVAVDNVLHDESAQSAQQQLARERDRQRLLLEVNNAVVAHLGLGDLFNAVSGCLRRVIQHDGSTLVLYDPDTRRYRAHVLDFTKATEFIEEGQASGDCTCPSSRAFTTRRPVIYQKRDLESLAAESEMARQLLDQGVKALCSVPLVSHDKALGTLDVMRVREQDFTSAESDLLHQAAHQVAIAVENALNYEQAQKARRELARERDRSALLLEINNAVVAHLDLDDLFTAVSGCLRKVIEHDGSSLLLCDAETGEWRIHVLDFARNESFVERGRNESVVWSPSCAAIETGKPAVFLEKDLIEKSAISDIARHLLAKGVKSFCSVPLLSHNRALGALNVGRRRDDGFTTADVDLLVQVAQQIAIAVENALAYKKIAELKDRLSEEKLYLEEEIQTEYNFEEIVGESRALKRVLKDVQTVATTASTVLILGETGSGKELVARALHNLSDRRDRTFVKLNCAAIPTGLLESELFGHEKGAFTGAIAAKIGRFELADRGTLFLDEVGDIPLELQVKLLRVLQEQEFERLGGTRTIRVNVRVVAATNRDLEQMVEEQRFRSDLYYRLKVFPMTVPPLRERVEDVPLLVRHFAQKFAQRMKKRIETIPSEAMKALQRYPWPGNVRELENFVERAVILTQGAHLFVPLTELKRAPKGAANSPTTLVQAEREHILKILHETNWVIGGTSGAASKLGMKRTTLQSKMQKLNISRSR